MFRAKRYIFSSDGKSSFFTTYIAAISTSFSWHFLVVPLPLLPNLLLTLLLLLMLLFIAAAAAGRQTHLYLARR
jgi:hypothetical protein